MADALDVITLTEAKTAINMPAATTHDTELAMWVTAVSRRLDARCGPMVVRTVTETLTPAGSTLFLTQYPVSSVTSVTEYQSGTGTVLTAESTTVAGGYLLDSGMLTRRSGFGTTGWHGRTTVEYVAGRYATTAAVDARVKMVAGAVMRRLWVRESGAWARGGDPFAQEGAGVGFFRVIDPLIDEHLSDMVLPPGIA